MSFFASSPPPLPRRIPRHRGPAWVRPPDNQIPVVLPLALVVSRSSDAAISVSKFAVYGSGFEFELTTLTRNASYPQPASPSYGFGRQLSVQVGIEYADGARVTVPPAAEAGVARISLLPQGGSASETAHRTTFWATPLPPNGPVRIAAAWPEQGISEGVVTLDGSELLAAAAAAVQLWPIEYDEPAEPDFSDAPALPVETTRPIDADEAELDIRAAFAQALDSRPPDGVDPLAAVQDGPALSGALAEARARFPRESAASRIAIGRIVFLDDVRAALTYRFAEGTVLGGFGAQLGYAVRERGEWKVARDTYCRVLGWAGVACPPPPPAP